ncbi:zinc finger protein 555-like isoform X2 [Prorops nasuta]|uniref:zinc finger protein 555-like isoform X2 n=1 Tax=Prorops nasuta TaxID=863751 RepID=UPI0034CECDB7
MGSLSLACPMCCDETFSNLQSLKYHILSITDNLFCPGCSKRSESVMALIKHLDQCGQDPESDDQEEAEAELKKERKPKINSKTLMDQMDQIDHIDQSFLATVDDNGIMIVGGPQTIQVDENGEIKVIEKMDVEGSQMVHNSISMGQKLESIMSEEEEKPMARISIPAKGGRADDKNMITILPDTTHLLEGTEGELIQMDDINNVEELDEAALLEVKQELCEMESEALYSCSTCGMSFNSVLEHIKEYHDGQEVVLEMVAQQLDDFATITPADPVTDVVQESENLIPGRQRQTMNTLRTEECVDSEGRLYTRKVVQIERFWDRNAQSSIQTAKSPMIEKFFSNAEGVKVRNKKAASMPLRMYKCNQCLEQFSKLVNFRVHSCLNGNNRCEHCDQTFPTAKALYLHSKVHETDLDPAKKMFVCDICGTEFGSHKSLRLHSRMHAPVRARHVDAPEGTPSKTFTCLECGKTLSESYRHAHMALHTGDSVTCTICNRKFDSADSLAMHAAVHTELTQSHSPTPPTVESSVDSNETQINNQKPYQCQHCNRRFTRPHEKVKHERIHTGEKPHACEVCGKTFRVTYCLTLHMRTHTGVRPYGCQHCGKRFKASSVYNHHLLTHGEERAYTCPYCPKTFKTRVQLAGHKNSHTKPFRCTECSRPFASLYAARAHIQTHKKDNNLKFSCYICGASYGRAFALKDHLKQHGQDVLAPPEPAREEEVQEGEDFLLAEEEVEETELIIPSPLPVTQSSEQEEFD